MNSDGSDAPMVPKGYRRLGEGGEGGGGGGPCPARLRGFRRGGGGNGPVRPRPRPRPGPVRFFFRGAMGELCAVRREAPVAFDSTVKHAHANVNQLNSLT
jgi:hypothetical protein